MNQPNRSMISVTLPTLNEESAIESVLERVHSALQGRLHEILVIDDRSTDKTAEIVSQYAINHSEVRLMRREGKRGLALAVQHGFRSARGDVLISMNADGQHDTSVLSTLADAVSHGATVAIASRYVSDAQMGPWARHRAFLSLIGTAATRFVCPFPVHDPLSGYFAVRRDVFETIDARLRPRGFKILLEILSFGDHSWTVCEVPSRFMARLAGRSKLRYRVLAQFAVQLSILCARKMKRVVRRSQTELKPKTGAAPMNFAKHLEKAEPITVPIAASKDPEPAHLQQASAR